MFEYSNKSPYDPLLGTTIAFDGQGAMPNNTNPPLIQPLCALTSSMIENNSTYRNLIQSYRDQYSTATNKAKSRIKDTIHLEVTGLTNPPVKLMKRRDHNLPFVVWLEVFPNDISDKIGADLRESRTNSNYCNMGAIGKPPPIQLPQPQDQVPLSMLQLAGQLIALCSTYNGAMAVINRTLQANEPVVQVPLVNNNNNQVLQREIARDAPMARASNVQGAANERARDQADSGNNNQLSEPENASIPPFIQFRNHQAPYAKNQVDLGPVMNGVNAQPLRPPEVADDPNPTYNQDLAMRRTQPGQLLHCVKYYKIINPDAANNQAPVVPVLTSQQALASLIGGLNNTYIPASNATNNHSPAVPALTSQQALAPFISGLNNNQGLTSNATIDQAPAVPTQPSQQAPGPFNDGVKYTYIVPSNMEYDPNGPPARTSNGDQL